jgi:hypothetical protein
MTKTKKAPHKKAPARNRKPRTLAKSNHPIGQHVSKIADLVHGALASAGIRDLKLSAMHFSENRHNRQHSHHRSFPKMEALISTQAGRYQYNGGCVMTASAPCWSHSLCNRSCLFKRSSLSAGDSLMKAPSSV